MAITKSSFIVLTTWINWITIANLVWAHESHGPHGPPPPPIHKKSTLDLREPTTYEEFIRDVRNNFAETDSQGNYVLKCDIQKISEVPPPERFMYVELIATPSKKVTLALDLSNAYVIGYLDKRDNKDRAFFFTEYYSQTSLIAGVFPTAVGRDREDLKFTGRYRDLEKYGDRRSIPLGISKLQSIITDIYGKNMKEIQVNQRKFLLMVVQMVSEAARFRYISDKIPQDAYATLSVDASVIALENGWDPLSTAVYQSKISTTMDTECRFTFDDGFLALINGRDPLSTSIYQAKNFTAATKCVLTQPVSLVLEKGETWTFNTIEDINKVIGILKAKGTKSLTSIDARAPQPPTLATLDLTSTNYPQFITDMRNAFSEKDKDGNDVLKCTMKKISKKVPSPRFGYVDIKASDTETVTLAIDRSDLYVLGYRDKLNGKDRAFFFKDAYDGAKDLFPDAKGKDNRIKLGYTSQYSALGDRTKVPLGIKNLRTSIRDIYGQAVTKSFILEQKTFFLMTLQMVSEATRFKYISDRIPTAEYETLKVDEYVTALENGWDPLSTAIHKNTEPSPSGKPTPSKCRLLKPVSLTLVPPNKWTFTTVEEIAQVVGLLKAESDKLSINNDNNNKDSYENNDNNSNDNYYSIVVGALGKLIKQLLFIIMSKF